MDAPTGKRIARMLATPITLLALLGVLFWGARWGYRSVTAPPPPPPIVSCSPVSVGKVLPSTKVTMNILNGGRQHGLASKVARTMKARGFVVKSVDNTEEKVEETIIVGVSKDDPAVKLVAQQFVKPTFREDGIPDGIVDVLVGNKFAGWTKTAPPWQIAVTQSPCLPPPSQTPTPSPTRPPSQTPTP